MTSHSHPGNTSASATKPQVESLDRMTSADTHCPYCALQCAMTLSGTGSGDLTVSGREFPTNRGGLCQKGWTSAELLRSPDRIRDGLADSGRAPDGTPSQSLCKGKCEMLGHPEVCRRRSAHRANELTIGHSAPARRAAVPSLSLVLGLFT